MTKPLSPNEIDAKKAIPDFVMQAANELLAQNWDGKQAILLLNDLVVRALNKKPPSDTRTRAQLYDQHAFDIEPVYRHAGWRVTFEKPDFNGPGQAYFLFER